MYVCVWWKRGRRILLRLEKLKNFPALLPAHRSWLDSPFFHPSGKLLSITTQSLRTTRPNKIASWGVGPSENSMLHLPRQTSPFCILPEEWNNKLSAPPENSTSENDPSSLRAGVQTWDPRLGEGPTVTFWFLANWQCVRNTTSSCIKWEMFIVLRLTYLVLCLFHLYFSPFLERPTGELWILWYGCAQKK